MNTLDQTTRAWMYRVALVLIAALIVIDVVRGGTSVQSWVAWIAGAIGLGSAGLATRHTSPKNSHPFGDSDHPDNTFGDSDHPDNTDEIPTSSG